jgi:hypothetical protein
MSCTKSCISSTDLGYEDKHKVAQKAMRGKHITSPPPSPGDRKLARMEGKVENSNETTKMLIVNKVEEEKESQLSLKAVIQQKQLTNMTICNLLILL